MNFFAELKRRNILRAAAFDAASAWLLVQVAAQVFPSPENPRWGRSWWVCSGGSASIPWRAPAAGRCIV